MTLKLTHIEHAIAQTDRYIADLYVELDDVTALRAALLELREKPALVLDQRPRRFLDGPPSPMPSVRPLPPLPISMARAHLRRDRPRKEAS